MKGLKIILPVTVAAALLCGCGNRGRLPQERDVYVSPDFRLTSHRVIRQGKTMFDASRYSGQDGWGDRLCLTSDYPLLDSVFAASVGYILDGKDAQTRHHAHAVWLGEVFADIGRARLNTGVDTLGETFPVVDEALPWPASNDRSSMVTASIDVALAAGDTTFTRKVAEISRTSLRNDFDIAYSGSRGLLYGSQTYLLPQPDLYPDWMTATDIYQSPCLGTNVAAVAAVSAMDKIDARPDDSVIARSKVVRANLGTSFFAPNLRYFSAYQYCYPYPLTVQSVDNMAESIGIVTGVFSPDTARMVIRHSPVFYAYTPTMLPLPPRWKKDADSIVQPVVQGFRALAAAKVRNRTAFRSGLAGLLDIASTSGFREYASPGVVGAVCRGLFGISFGKEGLNLTPYKPDFLNGRFDLRNLRVRDAVLNLSISGTGDSIVLMNIDGKEVTDGTIPYSLKGKHTVTVAVETRSKVPPDETIRNIRKSVMPPTPVVHWPGKRNALIANSDVSLSYGIFINGEFQTMLGGSEYSMFHPTEYTVINILPVFRNTWIGFSQPPYRYFPPGTRHILKGKRSGKDYMLSADIPAGKYLVHFTYRIGDRTAVARLQDDSEPVVFLERVKGDGSEFGRSSYTVINVGKHRRLSLRPVYGSLPEIHNAVAVAL